VLYPIFDKWVTFTRYCLHVKMLNHKATQIEAHVRGWLARICWRKIKHAVEVLSYFGLVVLAKKRRRDKEKSAIEREFEDWLPGEIERQSNRSNERENKRLLRQQKALLEMEKAAREELTKHLSSKNGKLQLKDIFDSKVRAAGPKAKLNEKEEIANATKLLLEECTEFCRPIHKHDFNSKNPVAFQCPDVTCGTIFSTEGQYHNHMKTSAKHGGRPPQYSKFHVMLKTKKGQESIRHFILRVEGIGELANSLDLWVSIQEWLKVPSSSEHYVSKALFIYENFLRPSCNRPVSIHFPNIEQVLSIIERIKHREYEGFYKLQITAPSGVRNVLRMDGVQYEAWTTENLVPGDIFSNVEWYAFLFLFERVEKLNFITSNEYLSFQQSVHEIEKRQRDANFLDFLDYREREQKKWLEDFLFEDNQRGNFADHVIEIYIESELSAEVDRLINRVAREESLALTLADQRDIEPMKLLVDDAFFWCTSDTCEYIYNFYVDIMLKTLIEKDDFREMLFAFADIEFHPIKKSKDDDSVTSSIDKDTWFDQFTGVAINEEVSLLPLDPIAAVIRIQRRVRGMQGRKKARRVFVTMYCKRFDQTSQCYYYESTITGETSWERPRIAAYLLPGSTW